MNDFLDAAATRSAHAIRAVGRTAFGGRIKQRAAAVGGVFGQARAVAAPVVEIRLRAMADRIGADGSSSGAGRRGAGTHEWAAGSGPAAPAAEGPELVDADEPCTCRGTGDAWCGATKRDVVYDLMFRGMHLSQTQAEHIWSSAQSARAAS